MIDPLSNPQAFDFITVAGVNSPGVCEVTGHDREYGFDVKKGKGTAGATTTQTSAPPMEPKVKFKLWTPAHFAAWPAFRALLKLDPTKKATQAFDIYHPFLAESECKAVVTKKIGGLVHEGNGLYSRVVEFLEYLPASKTSAVSTPTGSKSEAPGGFVGGPPGNPTDSAIANLKREIGALAGAAQTPPALPRAA